MVNTKYDTVAGVHHALDNLSATVPKCIDANFSSVFLVIEYGPQSLRVFA